MQTNKTKFTNLTLASLILCVIFVLARTCLLVFGYNFELNFFKNQNTAYVLFLLFAVFLFIILLSKKLFVPCDVNNDASPFSKGCYILVSIVFVLLFIIYTKEMLSYSKAPIYEKNALKTGTTYLLSPLSLISAFFTFTKVRGKSSKTLSSILAIFTVLFFGVVLIEKFARISATSMSLPLFPDVLCLLFMAYFVLVEGKEAIGEKVKTPAFYLAFFSAITFSTLPDLLMLSLEKAVLTDTRDTLFIILKILFILLSCEKIISFIKAQKD